MSGAAIHNVRETGTFKRDNEMGERVIHDARETGNFTRGNER